LEARTRPTTQGDDAPVRANFPHKDGVDKASVFKKAANFIVNFVAERPIVSPFPATSEIDPALLRLPNHENAVIAFEVASDSLHGATVRRSDGEVVLKNHISVSGHSYIDIIEALASVSPSQHFHCVAVLLEQLAYRANPECSYSCMK
jgi:hypothetical protein